MSKRIISVVLCLVIVLGLVAAVVPAMAVVTTSIKITADKDQAQPGDTITYTVTMGAVQNLYGLKLKLVFSEGLTYVEGSGKATDGLQATMNAAKAEFTEKTKIFIVGSSEYSSDSDIVLMQFKCVVADDATGTLTMSFNEDSVEFFDTDYEDIPYTLFNADVEVKTPCSHDWAAATCTAPKTCKLCGVTEGKALGHSWNAADCDTPKTCKTCGATEGTALGHSTVTYTNNGDTHSATYDCCGAAYVTNEAHSYDATTKTCVCGAVKADDFYVVAGSDTLLGSNWNPADMNNLLARDPITGIYSKTYTNVAAGTYEFKVVLNGAWGTEYNLEGDASMGGGNAKAVVVEDGSTVIIGFDGEKALLQIIAPACEHSWNAATCTTPKTCKLCGETEGDALGHDWTAADCDTAKTCKVCGATEGAALGHDWAAADCDTAKTCKTCGATEGAALGHSWAEATCTTAKTCTVCGYTEGTAGHDWVDATCTEPKTCRACGETEGEALGHSMSEIYSSDEDGHWLTCDVCDYADETEAHMDEDADKVCDLCDYELPADPEEPADPEDPEEPEDEEIPKTADASMMAVAVILMLAVCGTAVVLGKKRFA